jgi:hypothetical protein
MVRGMPRAAVAVDETGSHFTPVRKQTFVAAVVLVTVGIIADGDDRGTAAGSYGQHQTGLCRPGVAVQGRTPIRSRTERLGAEVISDKSFGYTGQQQHE